MREQPMTLRVRTLLIALALLLSLVGAGAWVFSYLGLYNVAATQQHLQPVYLLLDYALRRSVIRQADGIAAPPDLLEPGRIRRGVALYREQCLQCHGAPGVPPAPLAFGMTPAPVNLMPAAREWTAPQIYWLVKHGIKMSGMPAWEFRMTEQQMWDVTAFVKAMAAMSPVEYGRLVRAAPPQSPGTPAAQNAAPPAEPPVHPAPGHPPTGEAAAQPRPSEAPAPWRPASPAPGADSAQVLGNVRLGRLKVQAYLCITCHQIPGIIGALRPVGPPLDGIGGRTYIAGVIPNRPENMVRFLLNPQQVDPLSAMPPLGMSEPDARDIAAFLYTLRALP